MADGHKMASSTRDVYTSKSAQPTLMIGKYLIDNYKKCTFL